MDFFSLLSIFTITAKLSLWEKELSLSNLLWIERCTFLKDLMYLPITFFLKASFLSLYYLLAVVSDIKARRYVYLLIFYLIVMHFRYF